MTDDASSVELSSMLSDVSAVVRSAYIISHIDKMLRLTDLAEQAHHAMPKQMREVFERDVAHIDSFNEEAIIRLAYFFAKFPAPMMQSFKQMLHEIRNYIGVWVDGEDTDTGESQLFGMLNQSDMEVVEEMVTFVQKIGSRSTRHLLNFLKAVNDGDVAWVLIKGKGKDSEVSMRHRASEQCRQEFEIQ